MPSRAHNHKSLCAPGQDLHALGMQARLNVEPCLVTDDFGSLLIPDDNIQIGL